MFLIDDLSKRKDTEKKWKDYSCRW